MRIAKSAVVAFAILVSTMSWANASPARDAPQTAASPTQNPVPSGEPPPDAPTTQQAPLTGDSADDVLPLETDHRRRITVDVNVGDQGPYQFIIDTGAQRSVIARELAEQFGLQKSKRITVHTMVGVSTVDTVIIPRLAVNRLELSKLMVLSVGRRSIGAAGILGIDALQSRRILIDYRAGTMTLTPSVRLRKQWHVDWEGESVLVTARRRFGQLIITEAWVDDTRVDVVIDTGLELSVGNEALRRRMFGRSGRRAGEWFDTELVSVTGDVMKVEYTIVDRLRIADLAISNLPMAFADAHPFVVLEMLRRPAILLGADALRQFDQLSVDFRTRQVGFRWSTKPKKLETGQPADMSERNTAEADSDTLTPTP